MTRLFEWTLLLNLTSLSVYLEEFGPSAAIAVGFLGINLLLLAYYWPLTRGLLAQRSIVEWLIYLAAWPAVSMAFLAAAGAEIDLLWWAKADLVLAPLVLVSAVYVSLEGWQRFRRLVLIALALTALSFLMQWFAPAWFQRYTVGGGTPEFLGRTHGFFGGPNAAAQGIVMLAVAAAASLRPTSIREKVLPVAMMLVLVVVTGSRAGMLVAGVVAAILGWQMSSELRVGGRRVPAGLGAGALATVAIVLLVAAFLILPLVGELLESSGYWVLGERIAFWTEIGSTTDVLAEQSLATRIRVQLAFLAEILDKPILGHGAVEAREFEKTPHNMFIALAFEHGVLYVLFLSYLLWRLLSTRSATPESARLARAAALAGLVIAASALAYVGVLRVRPIAVVLGAVLGAKVSPLRATRAPQRVRGLLGLPFRGSA